MPAVDRIELNWPSAKANNRNWYSVEHASLSKRIESAICYLQIPALTNSVVAILAQSRLAAGLAGLGWRT
jgi:hypothetical protein